MQQQHTDQKSGGQAFPSSDTVLHFVLILASEGKLDRLDFAIINAMIADCTAGSRRIASVVKAPRATVQLRIKRIRNILNEA